MFLFVCTHSLYTMSYIVIVSLSLLTVSALSTFTFVHLSGVKGQVKDQRAANVTTVDVRCLTEFKTAT